MSNPTPSEHPYVALTPDRVIAALEACGYQCDARIFPLNSYENRVYQVGLTNAKAVVAKFYRPARWSDKQILEEHEFTLELEQLEIPVAPPEVLADGSTLAVDGEFRFAVFPRLSGRAPELDATGNLRAIGRYLGRIHRVGARKPFLTRETLTVEIMAEKSREFLLSRGFIPQELQPAYESLTSDLIQRLDTLFAAYSGARRIRIHGDCHPGNVLWQDGMPFFVDFDDAAMAPAVQDLWMLLSGSRSQRQGQLLELVEGYTEFWEFSASELSLIEGFRTLRILRYSAWLARRWEDPAFPRNFPWFNTVKYWSEHILELREQQAALDEPPLQLMR